MLCNILKTGGSLYGIEKRVITIGLTLGTEYSHNWSWEYCFVQGEESFSKIFFLTPGLDPWLKGIFTNNWSFYPWPNKHARENILGSLENIHMVGG